MDKVFIAIDPGQDGFITVFEPAANFYHFIPMPEHKVPTGNLLKSGQPEMKSEFNPGGFKEIIEHLEEEYRGYKIYGTIEDVTGRQGWSAQNNFNFGKVAGLQKMILIMLGADIEEVKPAKWQSFMYNGFDKVMVPSSTGKTKVHDTKATSSIVARTLAPEIDFRKTERSSKIHDGKTDSFLICQYRYLRHLKEK